MTSTKLLLPEFDLGLLTVARIITVPHTHLFPLIKVYSFHTFCAISYHPYLCKRTLGVKQSHHLSCCIP